MTQKPDKLVEIFGETFVKILALTPIEQMQFVEHLSAGICLKMNDKQHALIVAEGLHKHVKQLIEKLSKE